MMRAFPALCAFLVSATPAAAQAKFPSTVEVVRVDVLVTEKGKPLLGLGAADFEVRDNGVLQAVDFVSFEEMPLGVVLVLDMSSSVAGERLEHLRTAGRAVLSALGRNDQAALVSFGEAVFVRSRLTADVQRIRDALNAAAPEGYTSLIDATHTGILLGDSDVGRPLVILFSDGVDTASWLTTEAVLQTARRCDAVVYAVTPRAQRPADFLKELTKITGGDLLHVDSTRDLGATFLRILEEFRQRYLLSYAPRSVSHSGWHELQVRSKRRSGSVKARPGYLAGGSGDRD